MTGFRLNQLTESSVANVLHPAVVAAKPKTDSEWQLNAEVSKALRGVYKLEPTKDPTVAKITLLQYHLTIPEAGYKYLDEVFTQARQSQQIFTGQHSESIVEAISIMKDAEKVELGEGKKEKKEKGKKDNKKE